jgi:hypothetical protein
MRSYLDTIIHRHRNLRTAVSIAQVFKKAGVPTSTYYRSVKGGEMKFATAYKVWRMMELMDGANARPSDKRKLKPRVQSL